MSRDFTNWMLQRKKANKDENKDYLWELTTTHKKVNIINDFDEKIRKHYRGGKKVSLSADNNYEHQDVEKVYGQQ